MSNISNQNLSGGLPSTQSLLATVESGFAASTARLCDFLRIPSVSTDPAFDEQTRRCADWLVAELRAIGFTAEAAKTIGQPMVVAHHPGVGPDAAKRPRVLYYGHYDVQPADPIELWTSPPFEPSIVDGPRGKRVVARGAVDDKGQVMGIVEALRAWHAVAGGPPCPVTLMIEGEEESGSKSLEPFMHEAKARLAADVCIVSDTGMWDIKTPAITTRLRGLVYMEVTVHGPTRDLHSGMYGGAVANPINVLASIIAELHDEDRRVTIPGFYEGVSELSPQVRSQWDALGFNDAEFLGDIGLKDGLGERGRSTLERTWSRPTCDVNGIFGGYTGKGAKTVIAAHATAKVSFRLVSRQNPEKIAAAFTQFVQARLPSGCRAVFETHGVNPAIEVSEHSRYLTAASRGLQSVFAKEPLLIGTGGSIPAVGAIQRILGMDCLLVGFGLDDDCVHSPNEKFELECYRNSIRSQATILHELAQLSR
ncbi:MAG: M20/M25/M40 family metallo-hydrolase [Planctomycetota bacterium]|jgi:acetylornithine deacetylase/succinyl-diaminopimelate desuccinylase-like protein|nr:MAG: M20/M25/M40 family metallo-hydrolase [Planctomycetota bacterium]